MLLSPFSLMGEMGKEKRILNRQELLGKAELRTFLEIGYQNGSKFARFHLILTVYP
jgi:hypothetical protein